MITPFERALQAADSHYEAREHRNGHANGHSPDAPPPSRDGTSPGGHDPQPPKGSDGFPLTDLGNGERLVARHGENIRYCRAMGCWYAWNGQLWTPDAEVVVWQLQKETVRALHQDAKSLILDTSLKLETLEAANDGLSMREQGREALESAENQIRGMKESLKIARDTLKWARDSESKTKMEAALHSAQKEKGIPVHPSELDADTRLLNCRNGTVDLRTGELRPHDKADLVTKMCPVEYDPAATSDTWQNFLDRVQPDPEMQRFLQRAMGYSLTGDTGEEVLFFAFGPTSSGKSTFLKALGKALGDYSRTADFETFLAGNNRAAGGAKEDIARLAGARFVTSIEITKGAKLAEGLVKQITGGDVVAARHLYQKTFEFTPAFKLWLAANDEPKAPDDDAALWRRILQVPFSESIPLEERDPSVKAALIDPDLSGPALLAWAVQGCLDWQNSGLRVPASVTKATTDYRKSLNPLTDFISECCVVGPECRCRNDEIWNEYKNWAKASNVRYPLGRKTFSQRLTAEGFTPEVIHAARIWYGIGLLGPEPEMP